MRCTEAQGKSLTNRMARHTPLDNTVNTAGVKKTSILGRDTDLHGKALDTIVVALLSRHNDRLCFQTFGGRSRATPKLVGPLLK